MGFLAGSFAFEKPPTFAAAIIASNLKYTMKPGYLFFILAFISSDFCRGQKVHYVSPDATGLGTGATWIDAYTDLHVALDASQAGDSIFIKQGEYKPSIFDRGLYYELKSGVSMFGGFAGYETLVASRVGQPTVLSGNINNLSDSLDNSNKLLFLQNPNANTKVSGIIFEHGYAKSDSIMDITHPENAGGAVFIEAMDGVGSPIFENCVFRNNYAIGHGGAVYLHGDSINSSELNPRFIGCKFLNNYSNENGGGLYLAYKGQSGFATHVSACLFEKNTSRRAAGALYAHLYSDAQLRIIADSFHQNVTQTGSSSGVFLNTQRIKNLDFEIDSCLFDSVTIKNWAVNLYAQFADSMKLRLSVKNTRFTLNDSSNRFLIFDLGKPIVNLNFSRCLVEKGDMLASPAISFILGSVSYFDSLIISNNRFLSGRNTLPFRSAISQTGDKFPLIVENNYFASFEQTLPSFGLIRNNIFASGSVSYYRDYHRATGLTLQNNLFLGLKRLRLRVSPDTSNNLNVIENNLFYGCTDEFGVPFAPYLKNLSTISIVRNNYTDIPCGSLPVGIDCSQFIYTPNLVHELIDTLTKDFRLKPCSQLINKGVNPQVVNGLDLAGNPRVSDGVIDIGPYEAASISTDTSLIVRPGCGDNGAFELKMPFGCTISQYSWLRNDGQVGTGNTSLAAGVYIVTVSDLLARSTTFSVALPTLSLDSESDVQPVVCTNGLGGTIQILAPNGTPPLTCQWKDNPFIQSTYRNQLPTGVYPVIVRDSIGCSDTLDVTVPKNGNLTVLLDAETVQCFGDSTGSASVIPLNGKSPYAWKWNTGDTLSTLLQVPAGLYQATVTDALGCDKSVQFQLNQPDSLTLFATVLDATGISQSDGKIAIVSVAGGVAPYRFSWNDGDTTNNRFGLLPGDYHLTITDANGCTYSRLFQVTYPNDTDETQTARHFALYPNPASSKCLLKFEPLPKPAIVLISDIAGRTLFSKEIAKGEHEVELLFDLPYGFYQVQSVSEGRVLYQEVLCVLRK
jgi:predicted outer membrane repeat protein